MLTRTGFGQKTGWPEISAWPEPPVLDGVGAILREHFEHGSRHDVAQVNPAFDLRFHNVLVDGVAQVRAGDEVARIFEDSRHCKYLSAV